MKKTDIAMIILVASASIMVSYFIVNALPMFATEKQEAKVKVAEPITDQIVEPDDTVFNSDAINPTVEVIIGGSGDASQDDQVVSGNQ